MAVNTAKKRATVIDVARLARVSKSTVSLALKDSELLRKETRWRVHQAARQLGYVRNRSAARLRGASTDIIGMVINDLSNPFFAEMAVGIERACRRADVTPFIANVTEDVERQRSAMRSMVERGVAGLIISAAHGTTADDLSMVMDWGVPVTLVMREIPGAGLPTIVPQNKAGAELAVNHLISLGHRRIALVGGVRGEPAYQARLAGWKNALKRAGLPTGKNLIFTGPVTREGGARALGRALDFTSARPRAALCFNDIVAIGGVQELWRRGMTAGDDFAMVGFDDVAHGRMTTPELTTVSVDSAAIGEKAVETLLQNLGGGAFTGTIRTPVALAVRQTCGAGAPRPAS